MGLPEDESFQLTDVEQQVGASIGESDVIEMTIIAGTCVGFATIIGADGSNHFVAAVPSPKL